jgi:hypothetical protein
MNNELKNIFLNHQGKLSDKWSLYLEKWDEIFFPFRDSEINLLEIGIQNGGSLEIWAKYFSKAKNIIGCDIEEDCKKLKFEDPRISVVVGDANTDDIEEQISKISPDLDIIIDDGSHKSSDIIKSFARYFKLLNEDGVYVIEDLHASYWNEFEGGLYTPFSAMAFLKRLADIVNFEHWRNGKYRVNHLSEYDRKFRINLNEFDLCRIHSILFLNSLCIIRKKAPDKNRLGTRIVVGCEEVVTSGFDKLDGTSIVDNLTTTINDSHMDIFELENKIQAHNNQIQTLNNQIENLNTQLEEKESENLFYRQQISFLADKVTYYSESKSWRLTKPLREFMEIIRKIFNGNK